MLVFILSTGFVVVAKSSIYSYDYGNLKIEKHKDKVIYYDNKGNLIKTVDLKDKKIKYKNKMVEYFQVIDGSASELFNRYINALPIKQRNYNVIEDNMLELKDYIDYSYNSWGLLSSIKAYNQDDKFKYHIKYSYYENKKLKKKKKFNADGSLDSSDEYSYKYDNNNFKVQFTDYDTTNNYKVCEEYIYNKNNLLTRVITKNSDFFIYQDFKVYVWNQKRIYYNQKNQIVKIKYFNFDSYFNTKGFLDTYVLYEYNDKGLVTLASYYDKNEELFVYYRYNYNGLGLLKSEKIFNSDDSLRQDTRFFYDQKGRIAKELEYSKGSLIGIKEYEY